MPRAVALALVDPAREGDWNRILAYTREMLQAARRGEWEAVAKQQAHRGQLIRDYFGVGVGPHEAPRVEKGIREILASDRDLLDLTVRERDQVGAKVISLTRGSAARKAYAEGGSY